MNKPDLKNMNRAELKSLKGEVETALREFDDKRRNDALAAADAAAKAHGFSLAELLGETKKRRSKGPAKYRHPDNPELTWTGRGRHPDWFKEAVQSGISLEDMEAG